MTAGQYVQLQCAVPVVPGDISADGGLAGALRHSLTDHHPRLGHQQIHPQTPATAQHSQQRTARFHVQSSRR